MIASLLTRWLDLILAKPIRHLLESPRRLLGKFVERGMLVLDVGCGAGLHSLALARLVGPQGRVIAVDRQADPIGTLRQRAAQAGLSGRIETRGCSEQDLGLADLAGQVDFALAVYVIHHAADPDRLLSDVQAALKPGGHFLIVEPRHHASTAEQQAIATAARRAGFDIVDYPRLLRDWAVRLGKG